MSLDDKDFINPWDIIDTYFRDTPSYKSQHQIDSFDEFVFSKENGIDNIIRRENPFILYKGDQRGGGDKSFSYEMRIYFGETLDITTGEPVEGKENIFISSPAIYNADKQEMSYMYPNEARLKGLTYSTDIFCNIGVHYILHDEEKSVIKNFERVDLGKIPIMIHSKMCLLHKVDSIKLTEFGECPYDQGGYFIVKGKEKVMLSQEKKVNNILYINKSGEDNIILQGNIKSVSTEGFQSSRTNYVSYLKKNIKVKVGNKEIKRSENIFNVRILGLDCNVPLFILFRALGYETDKKILSLLIYENDDPSLKDKLFQLILPSVKSSQPIYNQKNAFKFLSLNTKGKENFNVINVLNNNLFPNYKNDNSAKAKYLGYVVRKILLTHIGIMNETDRDSYINKRVDLPGSLLLELYRELWGNFKRNISLSIDREYKLNFESLDKDYSTIINELNVGKIFSNQVLNTITKSFGARFGTGVSSRQGIVQELNRNVMLGTLSHTRRIAISLPSGSKMLGPRKLHNSQWGFICPTESPDGGNVGIMNHLSVIARVTTNVDPDGFYEALIDGGVLPNKNIITTDYWNSTKVFLNGSFIGVHIKPNELLRFMKLLKLNSIINITTSISWNIQSNEFHVFSDSGRIIRPIFHLKTNKNGEKYNKLIEKDYSLIKSWNHAIHGLLYHNDSVNVDFYTSKYFKEELEKIKSENEDYLGYLEENSAPLEYIDSIESENSLISRDMYDIKSEHTHCEIHSSLILSAVALNIPFPEHSQFPRNVFSCQQTKQAVGVYSSAYNTRFEVFSHILYYPQRPIVTTRYKKYTDVDKLPYGINAVVAIASYGGYNQEDGILLNKSSIDRGMFKSLYLRSYEEDETETKTGNEYFSNPLLEKNVQKLNTGRYENLDDNGFVKENTYVTDEDIIIAKCSKVIDSEGNEITKVRGTSVNRGTSGIVDKVVVLKQNDGLRKCKVRIRKEKVPGIGDKFSSRCGQKGMCGMVIPEWEMPFTKDGIVPDIIINPHAIPSRMTVNQLLEVILGKSACLGGFLGDATPFQNNDIREFSSVLEGFGYEGNGNEVMYSGMTGEQIQTSIFIGPTYYQRLKIMVADKMYSRSTGQQQHLLRQPAGGRANNGGLRLGEMERDAMIGHGISSFMNESFMGRSDAYKMQIDHKTGLQSHDDKKENKVMVNLPYCMKLLIQELQTMSLAPRLITDTNIDNVPVFKFLYENMSQYSVENDFLDDDIEEDGVDGE